MRIVELTEESRKDILENLLKRSPNNYTEFEGRVNAIIEKVRSDRDEAVFSYTKQFWLISANIMKNKDSSPGLHPRMVSF